MREISLSGNRLDREVGRADQVAVLAWYEGAPRRNGWICLTWKGQRPFAECWTILDQDAEDLLKRNRLYKDRENPETAFCILWGLSRNRFKAQENRISKPWLPQPTSASSLHLLLDQTSLLKSSQPVHPRRQTPAPVCEPLPPVILPFYPEEELGSQFISWPDSPSHSFAAPKGHFLRPWNTCPEMGAAWLISGAVSSDLLR